MGPGVPLMDGMQLEWQELGELFTRLLRCMPSQDKQPKALSTDVTRPATAQASDLSAGRRRDTRVSQRYDPHCRALSSRRKKPRRAGIARADHLWAVDAEQGHCDAASLRRRPQCDSEHPAHQPQGLVREQQQTQKVAMPYSRYQTALPPGEVAVVQGDFKPPVDQRPDRGTLFATEIWTCCSSKRRHFPAADAQPQNRDPATKDRRKHSMPSASDTLQTPCLPPDAVVDPPPLQPTPATPAGPRDFSEARSSITAPPARDSPSEGYCSECAPLSPRGVCSIRAEAAQRFKVYLTGAIIAAVALIVFILALPLGGRSDWDDGVCATPDCIRHALVLGILDRSQDNDSVPGPCDDFGTFVCKAARNRYGRLAADIVSQMILDWAARLGTETSSLGTSSDSFSKPAAMMQACKMCTGLWKGERIERLVELVGQPQLCLAHHRRRSEGECFTQIQLRDVSAGKDTGVASFPCSKMLPVSCFDKKIVEQCLQ
ncbi:hypothetical protein HPB48_025700 [Haemaphysalis longicornis]|uniref:Uncharacterized protein n=1 Tax=Haemaphysalis longicornis TaxID=44386 RepID=A0A9J6HAT2_HAELO|nr:hypothetical protein HPB48_025700 [Haemaphysalis longicornis]